MGPTPQQSPGRRVSTPGGGEALRDPIRLREIGILAAIGALSLAVRWPFRTAVIGRDEGEMLLAGQRILAGDLPYADLYLPQTPLAFYWSAAVQHVFGDDLAAIRAAAFAFGLLAAVVVYAATRRIGGPLAAAFAAAAFSAMSFDASGVFHQTTVESYLLLWVAVAVLLWGDGSRRRAPRALLAGVAAGLAYQTTQSGAGVLCFLFAERLWYWLAEERPIGRGPGAAFRDTVLAVSGFAGVFGATAAALAAGGALPEYLECTVIHAFASGRDPGWHLGGALRQAAAAIPRVALVDLGFWVFGAGALLWRGLRRPLLPGSGLWILPAVLAAWAVAAGSPRARDFEALIVPLAMGSGLVCAGLARTAFGDPRHAIRILAAFALGSVWLAPISKHLEDWRHPAARSTASWFDSSESIAAYVAERTGPDECLLIVGTESEVYFLADRPPCTRLVRSHLLTSGSADAPRLRRELREDLVSRRPRYVLLFADERSLGQPDSRLLLESVLDLLARDYTVEATLPGPGFARPGGADFVWVYRRR